MDKGSDVMTKIPFYLLTGYLGSGKTTLLKQILKSMDDGRKVAIVQNDFAPESVDGADLRQTGFSFEILEVNNGSVFCVCLLGSFVKSLTEFLDEVKPELLFMEASGLSDPISIAEMLQGSELAERIYLEHVWTVVDAGRFHKLARNLTRIQHQVRVADTVVLNKCDLVESGTDGIRDWISSLNPFASTVESSYCRMDIKLDSPESSFKMAPVALRRAHEHEKLEGSGRPDLGSCVIKTTQGISRNKLDSFLEEVGPDSYRIKGFVKLDDGQMVAVQSCFGQSEVRPVENYQAPTELVAMGPALVQADFTRRFMELVES
jgi:G3E family GTPase